jgi:hypothetical protein
LFLICNDTARSILTTLKEKTWGYNPKDKEKKRTQSISSDNTSQQQQQQQQQKQQQKQSPNDILQTDALASNDTVSI